ncbi:MAG: hypothetical protein AAGB34_07520 [Planctomycetota bacterium]
MMISALWTLDLITTGLAWIPFLEPMPLIARFWFATLPIIVFLTAAAYKGVQMHNFERYIWKTLAMTIQICALLMLLALLITIAFALLW